MLFGLRPHLIVGLLGFVLIVLAQWQIERELDKLRAMPSGKWFQKSSAPYLKTAVAAHRRVAPGSPWRKLGALGFILFAITPIILLLEVR